MSQYVINIGALPNDGTGDPLRTAFNDVNLNFNQVFAAGPVLSNIQIANNTILTTNTNGNLVLSPNGIGTIQANASIIPSVANVRNLGSASRQWGTVYTQYLNVGSGTSVSGDLTVSGNLTVSSRVTGNQFITTPVALANLTAVAGARAFVNNANLVASGNFGAQVGSGGSNVVPVWSDGANWFIG